MRFRFHDPARGTEPVVSVDGICPIGPNFSHWPGNRTPPELKHDLSTGIALNIAERIERDPHERERLFHGIEIVSNNHVDTDGILSAFVFLEPRLALAHRDLLLAAAKTGDFQVFTTRAALAIELTLTEVTEFVGRDLEPFERRQRQYEAALELVPRLLEHPFACLDQVERDFERILADVEAARSPAVTVRHEPALSLAVIEAPRELDRVATNTIAADSVRVLAIVPAGEGNLFRYHDRVESWFELVSREVPKRVRLDTLAARLELLEASETDAHWQSHAIDEPVPECWFGTTGTGASFGPTVAGALAPSRLKPRVVETAVRQHLEDGGTELGTNRRCK